MITFDAKDTKKEEKNKIEILVEEIGKIRNMLVVILFRAELLKDETLSQEGQKYIRDIKKQVVSINELLPDQE